MSDKHTDSFKNTHRLPTNCNSSIGTINCTVIDKDRQWSFINNALDKLHVITMELSSICHLIRILMIQSSMYHTLNHIYYAIIILLASIQF